MTGADALARIRAVYADRLGEARRRRAAGATLVGYFLNAVPVELILAAGLDPIRLVGDPARRSPLTERYLEEYFDGEVQSLFGAAMEGDFADMSLLVIPRTAETYLQLYYFLKEIPKWELQASVPPLHLFDLLQTPHWTVAQYDLGRMRALAARLEEIGGARIDEAALRTAIATCNRLRSLLGQASTLWQGDAPSLSGVDALAVIAAASVLHPDEAVPALEALVADPPPVRRDDRPRVLLKGSPQSDPRVTALIEEAGARVVAHDHVAGDTTYDTLVSEGGDPWEALVHHYQLGIPGLRAYPQRAQDQRFLALVERSRAEVVIFFHDQYDDTLGWEYPDQKKLLDARGIPSLFLKQQPYLDPPVAEQHAAVAGFLATLQKVPA
ncbi:benzoyl-CoA reductase (2-electron) gamma subunit [Sphingomonas guangdongensis]|uniref:Benzoyl-CoA reductase (2-electron) gamma subunit n=1 Tax=Sphingomonas guangdongensis TaxID=1141890 RepID=A0A285QDD5_9SPHN|nr:2-hydroxyacyl-CoA dehydratase family protein [Sphingomonas guangdongensis]SOB79494.1 benzoyl-CoA reductase (2-electron) gamma subunit [Sphingomonas guangdongensis]